MPKVTTTRNIGGHTAGSVINVSAGAAAYLVNTGAATVAEATPAKVGRKAKTATETTPERGGGASPAAAALTVG